MLRGELREEFVALLHAHVPGLRINGTQATGHVPWCEDKHPSFSADLDKGAWHDHARQEGGGVKDFKARLGLNGVGPQQARKIVATYDYTDEHDSLLFQVLRYDPKDFSQRRPDGKGGWVYSIKGVRRVPYRLPEVMAASEVLIGEGEKVVDCLRSHGFVATCNPHGAGKWLPELNQYCARKHVAILPDNDETGENHAWDVARSLLPVATAVKIVRLPGLLPKGDVSDWLDAGHTKEKLAEIVKNTPVLRAEDLAGTAESTKKSPAILTRLSDVVPQPVRWLWRGRIPFGKVTILDGDPGLGKSLVSLDVAARVSTARTMPDGTTGDLIEPAGVVLLSAEDDSADTIRPRLEAAGADVSRIVHLRAVREADGTMQPVTLTSLTELQTAINEVNAKLVIVDPLMAFLPAKVDSHRDQDIRRSLAPLVALAAETGVAVLVIRHLNKTSSTGNPLYRGGGSIGIIGAGEKRVAGGKRS